MKTLGRSVSIALVSAGLAACGGSGQPSSLTATTVLTVSPVARLTHRMPRGGSSTVSVRTLPNSACLLRVVGQPEDRTLSVYADDQGVARVHLDHLDATVDGGQLTLTCSDDSAATLTHTIDLIADDTAVAQPPAPYDVSGLPTLAPLEGDPATLSNRDLLTRHYPPRPDATARPAEYAQWLKLVQSAPSIITPHVVADPGRRHAAYGYSSNAWSGYVLVSPETAPIYAWITGEWKVPQLYGESGFFNRDHSSQWIGIDGWVGYNDVVQDGIDADTYSSFWVQSTSYHAWIEWYPLDSSSVSNFPLNPGDDLHAWTWLLDAAGNYDPHPTVAWFYLWNATQNVYTYTSVSIPSGATFQGHSAEWIVERPTNFGSVSSLADYGTIQMTNAWTVDLAGATHLYAGDTSDDSWQISMYGDSDDALSTVQAVDPATMQFTYHAHD